MKEKKIDGNNDPVYHIKENHLEIGWDKLVHFIMCCLITLIPYLISSDVKWGFLGFLMAVMIGFMKELIDKFVRHTKFDWVDIVADILGAFAGIALMTILFAI